MTTKGKNQSKKATAINVFIITLAVLCTALTTASANVTVSALFSNDMVLQRGKPISIYGTAAAAENVTVSFNGQAPSTTADSQGNWQVTLTSMTANTTGQTMTITGNNVVTITDVVVGDIWVCSGQSNMAFGLGGCNRQSDIDSANFPGIRQFSVPLANLGDPTKNLTGNWTVCSPSTAAGFSAVAFYYARKIYQDQSSSIPIGLLVTSVGGTCIDPWLAPEGCTDVPVIAPIFSQSILPWGPFSLFNGMVYPCAPYAVKGAIWYQGENRETTSQSTDSYFLKEKALAQGWKRLWGMDDFPFYLVLLANYLDPPSGSNVAPDMPGATWADTRIQQMNILGVPHGGVGSAIDIGDAANIHPTDKLDVGERLAIWALKNDYGRTTLVPSGPVLNNVTVSGNKATCTFDYVGAGLMVGSKTPYQPTQEVVGGTLGKFSIAGSNGTWYDATAVINGSAVDLTSASVSAPTKVAYACWTNPAGANLYNRDGLPAAPFYVDDVTAKYTVTASAGSGGTISPTGVTTYLKRKTALYTITPNANYYITNVTVDSVSVGAVKYYTFDPLYANHTIAATFGTTNPNFTVTASAGSGGTISPTGAQSVAEGGSKTFTITPNAGCLISLAVDGCAMGARKSFTFGDVRANHTISATFTTTINAQSGYGGTISPSGLTVVTYGANQTYTITPSTGYSISKVTVDGSNVGAVSSYTFTNVTTSHTITATFAGSGGGGSVPQQSQIIFSCLVDTLPASGAISSWPTYIPSGQSLSPIGTPTVTTIDGKKFSHNVYLDYDGFNQGSYSSPIACTGASIVVVAKPARFGTDSGNWQSIVDVFYDRMVLGVMNGSGKVCVRRNGSIEYGTDTIPDGQTTILSLVVQSDGSYKVFANGTQTMSVATNGTFTSLVNGVAGGFANNITVGRNWPDGWTTFNGDIGDVFLYKTALTDTERVNLETYMANRLTGTVVQYTITASAGTGGTISPSGGVLVNQGANQTFTITPNIGYAVSQVTVDSVNQGAITSYTFNNVQANHTISATFVAVPTYTITASAGTGGTISPSGAVIVNQGANQTFSISANTGYAISQVTVDSVNQGAISTYTFTNVQANHTISVTFNVVSGGIPRTADLLFSCSTDSFPASGSTGNWATYIPSGQTLTMIGTPTVDTVNGVKWEQNLYNDGDGYLYGMYSSAIPVNGATITLAVKPALGTTTHDWDWRSAVDIFYDRLVIGVHNWDGKICVRRNGSLDTSTGAIPDGQKTILSIVVQPDGTYRVYANGTLMMDITTTSAMTSLDPLWNGGTTGFWSYINVGRNNPDGWTTFNGDIGDVFVYKVALSDADRQSLETTLTNKFINGTTNFNITASAGTGGTISPSGTVVVPQGGNQTFTITPNSGYAISQVTVDSVNQGAISSYTFTNVQAAHTISATFSALPTYTITASAGTGGTITPSGAVVVNQGANQTFNIAANSGYAISQVTVDSVNQGAITTYTFTNVQANHTISATFVANQFTITASAGTGGTITPSGAVLVNPGANQSFTIAPSSGYMISSVTVDSVNVGCLRTYTFTNVQANHTIAVAFATNTDLVAYYKFDETLGTTAYDSTANAKNGTLYGSCTWAAGKTNNAVSIPGGSSDYVGLPTGIVSGLTNFTIVAWVKLTSVSTNMRIFDFGTTSSNYMMMTPKHSNSSGKIEFYIRTSSTTKSVLGAAALPTGSWQQVAVTLSSQTLTLYVQGAQVGQITNCSINPNSLGSTTNNYIGKSQTSSHPHLNGLVDGFRIYNRALSGAEISTLYGGGAGPASVDEDDSGWDIYPAK